MDKGISMATDQLSENDSTEKKRTPKFSESHTTMNIEDMVTDFISSRAGSDSGVDEILFYVPNNSDPIRCRKDQVIVLGREVSEMQHVTHIDLSEYGALQYGVSRVHAFVQFVDDNLYVEDKNSRNGTWINNRRIPPEVYHIVKSGDQLRLAELVLTVFFGAVDDVQEVSEQIVRMAYTHSGGSWWRGIPPIAAVALSVHAAKALVNLQSILHKLNNRKVDDFGLTALKLDVSTESFQMKASNCDNIPDIIGFIDEWCEEYPGLARSLRKFTLAQFATDYDELGMQLGSKIDKQQRARFVTMIQNLVDFPDAIQVSSTDARDIVVASTILVGTALKYYA